MKITHMWRRWGAHLRISLCHLLMNFEKHKKSDFWKNEKKIYWRSHHFTHLYQKSQSHEVQFLRYGMRHIFLSFWIILQLHITNDDHMMYGSWDIKQHRHDFLSIWAIFCLFTPSNNPENQNFEKMKKTPGDNHFTHEYHK